MINIKNALIVNESNKAHYSFYILIDNKKSINDM